MRREWRLLLRRRRRRDGHGCAGGGERNHVVVEAEFALEDDVHGGAARKFGFGAAREEDSAEADEAADSGADACAFAAAGNRTDARARNCGGGDGAGILTASSGAGDFAFLIGGLLAAGVGAARCG